MVISITDSNDNVNINKCVYTKQLQKYHELTRANDLNKILPIRPLIGTSNYTQLIFNEFIHSIYACFETTQNQYSCP